MQYTYRYNVYHVNVVQCHTDCIRSIYGQVTVIRARWDGSFLITSEKMTGHFEEL